MRGFCKVTIAANVTRDPETRFTPKGIAVCNMGLAVNRAWTGEDGQKKEAVTFLDCTAFKGTAEILGQYVRKGDPILVNGTIRQENWEDKQTGQKRSKLYVLIEEITLLGNNRQDAPGEASPPAGRTGAAKPATGTQRATQAPADPPYDDGEDGQIPF